MLYFSSVVSGKVGLGDIAPMKYAKYFAVF